MKTNRDRLIEMAVLGEVAPPVKRASYTVRHDGKAMILPGVGGITYNVKVGDPVMGWVGDHIEPGVSTKILDPGKPEMNCAYNILSCIGNRAQVITGDAKGKRGYVTGKHGGIEHVIIYFSKEDLENLAINDKIQVRSIGQGLSILDLKEIQIMNLDPDLLEKIGPEIQGDFLEVPVRAMIPPELMGSGLGSFSASQGDYDITSAHEETLKEHGLDTLCFGDLVAIMDSDHSYGRCYRKGALSIGVVIHSNCILAGHGPGVTTIFTSPTGKIRPVMDEGANLAKYLNLS